MNIVYCKVIKNDNGRYQLIDVSGKVFPMIEQLQSYIVKTAYTKHEAIRIPYLTEEGTDKLTLKANSSLLQRVSMDTYNEAVESFNKKNKS